MSICSMISDKLELVIILSTMPDTKSVSAMSAGLICSKFNSEYDSDNPVNSDNPDPDPDPDSMQFNLFLMSSMV